MNNITIAGPLGKDAELKSLHDGKPYIKFSVADSQGREKPTIWWNCTMFGMRAEKLHQYMSKGQHVAVFGVVTEREYKTADGEPRKSVEINVNDVALMGKSQAQPAPQPAPRQAPARPQQNSSGFDDIDNDIPF